VQDQAAVGPVFDPRSETARPDEVCLAGLAEACGLDVRDLEAGLVRLDLTRGRVMADCPGGRACPALRRPVARWTRRDYYRVLGVLIKAGPSR